MTYTPAKHRIFHLLCYYLVWLVGLYSAGYHQSWIGILLTAIILCVQVFWQYQVAHDTRDLWRFMAQMTLVSVVVDAIMVWGYIVYYQDNIFYPYLGPPWIMAQWLEFAMICHALLEALWRRPFYTGILTFMGFTLVYVGGARIGAVDLTYGWWSAVIIGAIWLLLLPVLLLKHDREVKKC